MAKINRFHNPGQVRHIQDYVSQYVAPPFEELQLEAERKQQKQDAYENAIDEAMNKTFETDPHREGQRQYIKSRYTEPLYNLSTQNLDFTKEENQQKAAALIHGAQNDPIFRNLKLSHEGWEKHKENKQDLKKKGEFHEMYDSYRAEDYEAKVNALTEDGEIDPVAYNQYMAQRPYRDATMRAYKDPRNTMRDIISGIASGYTDVEAYLKKHPNAAANANVSMEEFKETFQQAVQNFDNADTIGALTRKVKTESITKDDVAEVAASVVNPFLRSADGTTYLHEFMHNNADALGINPYDVSKFSYENLDKFFGEDTANTIRKTVKQNAEQDLKHYASKQLFSNYTYKEDMKNLSAAALKKREATDSNPTITKKGHVYIPKVSDIKSLEGVRQANRRDLGNFQETIRKAYQAEGTSHDEYMDKFISSLKDYAERKDEEGLYVDAIGTGEDKKYEPKLEKFLTDVANGELSPWEVNNILGGDFSSGVILDIVDSAKSINQKKRERSEAVEEVKNSLIKNEFAAKADILRNPDTALARYKEQKAKSFNPELKGRFGEQFDIKEINEKINNYFRERGKDNPDNVESINAKDFNSIVDEYFEDGGVELNRSQKNSISHLIFRYRNDIRDNDIMETINEFNDVVDERIEKRFQNLPSYQVDLSDVHPYDGESRERTEAFNKYFKNNYTQLYDLQVYGIWDGEGDDEGERMVLDGRTKVTIRDLFKGQSKEKMNDVLKEASKNGFHFSEMPNRDGEHVLSFNMLIPPEDEDGEATTQRVYIKQNELKLTGDFQLGRRTEIENKNKDYLAHIMTGSPAENNPYPGLSDDFKVIVPKDATDIEEINLKEGTPQGNPLPANYNFSSKIEMGTDPKGNPEYKIFSESETRKILFIAEAINQLGQSNAGMSLKDLKEELKKSLRSNNSYTYINNTYSEILNSLE